MAKIGFRKIWEEVRKSTFLPETGLMLPDAVVFHKYNKTIPTAMCRRTDSRKNRFDIVYGMEAIQSYINDELKRAEEREIKKAIVIMYITYFYHESAHLLYTDMSMSEFKKITDPRKQSYAAELNNILEDSYIQYRRMGKEKPFTKKFFLDMDRKLFRDSVIAKYKDTHDLPAIGNYLLYSLRRGSAFKGENTFINIHEEEVNKWVTTFLNEHDAVKRSRVAIDFLDWILSTGEIVLPAAESAVGKDLIGKAFDVDTAKSKPEKLPPVVYESKPKTPEERESKYDGDDVVDEEDGEDEYDPDSPKEDKEDKEDEEDDTLFFNDEVEEEPSEDELEADIKEELKPDPYIEELDLLGLNHQFIDLDGYTHTWSPIHEKDLGAINTIGKATTKSIMIKLEREKPRYHAGKDAGRLDVGSVISRTDGKVFKEKTKELPIPKLAFSLLMDNSGSISSQQTEVSTVAALSLVKACEELEIPVEVNAFTSDQDGSWGESNTWVTWEVKPFEADFNYATLHASKFLYKGMFEIDGHRSFGGNMEEVNIAHIASRFTKLYKDRQKVLIVLCDGQTTGSTAKLRRVLDVVADDMYVIGIGLGVNLSSIYKKTFTLASAAEVANLPLLMRDILKGFVFGEE